jgi:hypothetical protein
MVIFALPSVSLPSTSIHPPAPLYLYLQPPGNLAIFDRDGNAKWATASRMSQPPANTIDGFWMCAYNYVRTSVGIFKCGRPLDPASIRIEFGQCVQVGNEHASKVTIDYH